MPVHARSIVIVSPDAEFGVSIAEALAQRGHIVARHTGTTGMFPYLRETQPDFLILTLSPACRREHWRLLEQLYWDPTISTRALAIVAPDLPRRDLAMLRAQATGLPLLFDVAELDAAIDAGAESQEPFPIAPLPRLASLFASGFGS